MDTEAATSLLERVNFATRFARSDLRDRCVNSLREILVRLDAAAPFPAQVEWLEDLSAWLHGGPAMKNRVGSEPHATSRLKLLLAVLTALPEQKQALRTVIARAFDETDAVRLFTDTGLPSKLGFVGEAVERAGKRLLPEPPVERDAARLLHRLFPTHKSANWFEQLSPELTAELFEAFAVPTGAALLPLQGAMREGAVLLATRIAAHGLADDFRERSPRAAVGSSPFLELPRAVQALTGQVASAVDSRAPDVWCREVVASCRKVSREVLASLDSTGVSVDLVYRLEVIARQLDRLYALIVLLSPAPVAGTGFKLARTLVRGGVRDRSIGDLVRTNSKLLARRVIERAGHGGEHYITRSRTEQHELLDSAGGGGVVTGLAVFLKFLTQWAHLPPLIEGLAFGLNYAIGFVVMQLAGFTLATKQPAMTAAALAGALSDTHSSGEKVDLEPLVDQVVCTVRSQLAAAAGNVGMAIPASIIINFAFYLGSGHHVLSHEYAHKVVHAHHPFGSATILYAALTGVFLWVASLLAGMIENWFVLRRLAGAIATHRGLRALVGSQRTQQVADFFARNISGFGGNVGFGLILGFAPVAGLLVGIPIEVRHLTFVTGQITYAGLSLGSEGAFTGDFLWAVSSIFVVGALNFLVSFSLALVVALRAREVGAVDQFALFRAVVRRLSVTPMDFVRAPA